MMAGRWGISSGSWQGGHGTYLIWQDIGSAASLTVTCVTGSLINEYPGYFEMLNIDGDAKNLIVWGREAGHRNWEFAW
jgi:hypothetical protein